MSQGLEAVKARQAKAHDELLRVTGMGKYASGPRGGPPGRVQITIPADPDRDTDLIIGDSLHDVTLLVSEVEALASLLSCQPDEVRGKVEELVWIAQHATALGSAFSSAVLVGAQWSVKTIKFRQMSPSIYAAAAALRHAETPGRGSR